MWGFQLEIIICKREQGLNWLKQLSILVANTVWNRHTHTRTHTHTHTHTHTRTHTNTQGANLKGVGVGANAPSVPLPLLHKLNCDVGCVNVLFVAAALFCWLFCISCFVGLFLYFLFCQLANLVILGANSSEFAACKTLLCYSHISTSRQDKQLYLSCKIELQFVFKLLCFWTIWAKCLQSTKFQQPA